MFKISLLNKEKFYIDIQIKSIRLTDNVLRPVIPAVQGIEKEPSGKSDLLFINTTPASIGS